MPLLFQLLEVSAHRLPRHPDDGGDLVMGDLDGWYASAAPRYSMVYFMQIMSYWLLDLSHCFGLVITL